MKTGYYVISENLPEHSGFPQLLPRNHVFTCVVLKSFHEKLMHEGVCHTLAANRREFLIPQGISAVKRVLLNCLRCRIPAMAPYLRSRVEESPPITYTGPEYPGRSYVKVSQPSATQNVWLCVFAHLAGRAIQLEVVRDLTAEQFLS